MVDLLTQMAALTAANLALQGQVANMQPGVTAPTSATYARTPEFMGQSELLDFRKKANLSVYAEGKSPVFEGDKQFDVKTETLGPFLKRQLTNVGTIQATHRKSLCSTSCTMV